MLVHGGPKVGKSWLGQTTPEPRLVLDCEGGSRTPWRMVPGTTGVRQKVVRWNPRTEDPPTVGDWQVCHVSVQDFDTFAAAYQWLASGRHPFKSLVIDSLTELQKRCKDTLAGAGEVMDERKWGILLTQMEHIVRHMRDLSFHPTRPLDAVVLIALTKLADGVQKPEIQGALGRSLPGYVDLEGYLFVDLDEEQNPYRRLLITPRPGFEAGDRTHSLTMYYGPAINNPDVEEMLRVYNEGE